MSMLSVSPSTNGVRRAVLALSALIGLGAALPACAADLLDSVKARGSLRIALEGTYPPFNFKDAKTGQLVAARLGVKPEFVTT